jgi:undecaprenyl-diphosphatase
VLLVATNSVDESVYRFFVQHRTDLLTTVMKVITWLGSGWVLAPVAIGAGLVWMIRRRTVRPLLLLLAALIGASLLSTTIKRLVGRSRPPIETMLVHAHGFSFPSGHATESTAVYGMLAVLVARELRSRAQRILLWATTVVLLLLIGLSRIYLGVHWLTDVLFGYVVGATWVVAVLAVDRTLNRTRGSEVAAQLPELREEPPIQRGPEIANP